MPNYITNCKNYFSRKDLNLKYIQKGPDYTTSLATSWNIFCVDRVEEAIQWVFGIFSASNVLGVF